MQTVTDGFTHVLLFDCPECGSPVASACPSPEKNLEGADADWFNLACHFGWTESLIGGQALKHWVEPWKIPVNEEPESPIPAMASHVKKTLFVKLYQYRPVLAPTRIYIIIQNR